MGTKYIIEVEDKPFELLSEDGFTSEKLFRVKGFNSLVFDWNGLNMLTPYTEPDFEHIRKEAYQKGYETGYEDGYNEPGKNQQEVYQRGLNDAWEAASEIAVIPYDEMEKIFGATGWHIFMKYTASEAIEKIRQYEQEKEEIKVGDEVTAEHGGSTFTVTWMSDICICGIDSEGRCYSYMLDEVDGKTGNHHEIAAVLEKMRGGQDG